MSKAGVLSLLALGCAAVSSPEAQAGVFLKTICGDASAIHSLQGPRYLPVEQAGEGAWNELLGLLRRFSGYAEERLDDVAATSGIFVSSGFNRPGPLQNHCLILATGDLARDIRDELANTKLAPSALSRANQTALELGGVTASSSSR